jgi:hypothetical protein
MRIRYYISPFLMQTLVQLMLAAMTLVNGVARANAPIVSLPYVAFFLTFVGVISLPREETSMRFYTKQHPYDCGIDLHPRTTYVCILDQAGETLLYRNMQATPEALLKAIAPYHEANRF